MPYLLQVVEAAATRAVAAAQAAWRHMPFLVAVVSILGPLWLAAVAQGQPIGPLRGLTARPVQSLGLQQVLLSLHQEAAGQAA